MNNWDEKKKFAIVEADDFMDQWDRNGLNFLFYWKAKYPKFKISLFTVPNRTSQEMMNLITRHSDWIELLVHGWNHESNFECYGWSEEKTQLIMNRVGKFIYYPDSIEDLKKTDSKKAEEYTKHIFKKVFKAPGWTITPGHNGYPAGERDPLKDDPQAVYRGLMGMGFTVFDRHYNVPARLEDDSNIVCVDCQPDLVHFHTWNVPSGDINGRNGFQDVEENFGVPWDENTEFKFVTEAIKEGLFKPCVK